MFSDDEYDEYDEYGEEPNPGNDEVLSDEEIDKILTAMGCQGIDDQVYLESTTTDKNPSVPAEYRVDFSALRWFDSIMSNKPQREITRLVQARMQYLGGRVLGVSLSRISQLMPTDAPQPGILYSGVIPTRISGPAAPFWIDVSIGLAEVLDLNELDGYIRVIAVSLLQAWGVLINDTPDEFILSTLKRDRSVAPTYVPETPGLLLDFTIGIKDDHNKTHGHRISIYFPLTVGLIDRLLYFCPDALPGNTVAKTLKALNCHTPRATWAVSTPLEAKIMLGPFTTYNLATMRPKTWVPIGSRVELFTGEIPFARGVLKVTDGIVGVEITSISPEA